MFGYILPEKPELKIKEYELFRAYYCGVCKSIGRRFGQIPRLTLNYDATFLALLLSSMRDERICVSRDRCIAHPLKKKSIIEGDNVIDYASDINILLTYYNLKDNWDDDRSFLSAAGMLALRSGYKKLRLKYRDKCDIIEAKLKELSELEAEGCNSVDRAAEPFAKLMEEIFAYKPLLEDNKNEKILRWIGYNIGRWIYIADAYDDIDDDIKSKAYNPLLRQYVFENTENAEKFKERIRERVEFNMTYCLSEIAKAYELLDIKKNDSIAKNIIYMGMLRKTEQILKIGVV